METRICNLSDTPTPGRPGGYSFQVNVDGAWLFPAPQQAAPTGPLCWPLPWERDRARRVFDKRATLYLAFDDLHLYGLLPKPL